MLTQILSDLLTATRRRVVHPRWYGRENAFRAENSANKNFMEVFTMSGKMKKLICALLTGAMLVSSAGMLAFAADPDSPDNGEAEATETIAPDADATEAPADNAESTEAPAEATEAPAATTAPAVSTKYDNDEYYKRALALCQGLGIITGREDGNVDPEAKVTRAEMAAIILRMLAHAPTSPYQNIFTDVTSDHWAANTIQTAAAFKIINGYPEDNTFRPDNDVQYEQVAKMIVCAMNYHETAEYNGGYPNGYIKVAADLGITKNALGSTGVASERGVVIKMVYNALLADYNEPHGAEYGESKYQAFRSLAEYSFDVKEATGVLLGTNITSLTGAKYQKGQIHVSVKRDDNVNEEVTFLTDLTGLEDLLASNITFYYEDVAGRGERKLLAITENSSKTETVNISRKDVEDIDEFTGFENTAAEGSIKVHGESRHKIVANPIVIYNGSLLTLAEFTKAQDDNSAKKDDVRLYKNIVKDSSGKVTSADPKTFSEFLKPEIGTIKLVDNDMDGKYDIVFIDSYETMLVTSATSKKVIGKINNESATINVDEIENDLTIKTTISGMEAAPRNLKKNNVVSVKRSLDGETIEFISTGESFTGTIQSVADEDGKKVITVAGEDYDVDANAADDCKTGIQAIFYTDVFDRVGYVEASTSGKLQSGEKYAWIMGIYNSTNGEDTIVNLYTQDGKTVEATLGSNVDFWGVNNTSSSSKSAADVKAALTSGTGDNISINDNAFLKLNETGSTPIRLVKYKMNANNEITRLYCAVKAADVADTNALRINPTNLNGAKAVSGSVNGYTIVDGILEFTVPKELSDMKTASNYAVGEVASTNYVQGGDNSASRDFVIGEFDGIAVNIVINFTSSATAKAPYTEMGTAEGGPSIMVVEKIAEGYDSENEVPIYTISGYSGGSAVSVKTNKNTVLGNAQKTLTIRANDNTYFNGFGDSASNKQELWNAPGAGSDKLTNHLSKGDIILYTGDGRVLLRFASAANATLNPDGSLDETSIPTINCDGAPGSHTRVAYYFGKVLDSGLDDVAYVSTTNTNGNITFSPDQVIDLVTIDKGGNVKVEKETLSVSELEQGDYLLINIVDKRKVIKSMIVYRFEN